MSWCWRIQAAILTLSQIGGEDAGQAIQGLMDGEVNEDEADLIQGALERLDFQEEGLDLAMFNLDLQDRDNYILDDYDIEQDGLGDDLEDEYDDYGYSDDYGGGFDDDEPDFDLDSFDLDDDYWME